MNESDRTGKFENEASKEMEIDGFKLEIHARRIDEEGWTLCVINELGVMFHWIDFFETAQDALDAADKAIETEGLEGFLGTEDFGYLLH